MAVSNPQTFRASVLVVGQLSEERLCVPTTGRLAIDIHRGTSVVDTTDECNPHSIVAVKGVTTTLLIVGFRTIRNGHTTLIVVAQTSVVIVILLQTPMHKVIGRPEGILHHVINHAHGFNEHKMIHDGVHNHMLLAMFEHISHTILICIVLIGACVCGNGSSG